MRDTYAILALRHKRAYLVGEVAAAERQVAAKRKTLAALDATIQLFEPATNPELIAAIRPTRHGSFFRHGEQMRFCVMALCEAAGPMSARQVAERAMLAKGLPLGNAPILSSITVQVRGAGEARGQGDSGEDYTPARRMVGAGGDVKSTGQP
jgi:hypothetical protein